MKAIRSDSEISAIAESCEIAALVLQYLVDSTSEVFLRMILIN